MAPRSREARLRQELVQACRRLAAVGLIGGGEGNLSVRLDARRLLATPSGSNKALLKPSQLVVTDLQGKARRGPRRASSEFAMHVAIYRARPDVGAVVHAHPPAAVTLTLAGLALDAPRMPEAVTALGGAVPTAPYATPSTRALADTVAAHLRESDACLLERHGAVAVGATLSEACDRMEIVERIAAVEMRLKVLGLAPAPLPPDEVERLLRLSGRKS